MWFVMISLSCELIIINYISAFSNILSQQLHRIVYICFWGIVIWIFWGWFIVLLLYVFIKWICIFLLDITL